ncbi:MAG: M28 family peptidase [Bacteroidales bacterium]|nr:M28 family peptidase [Bacteroidales bacterium]
MKFHKTLFLVALLCLSVTSCHNKKNTSTDVSNPTVTPPDFDVDSAFSYVKAQTDFGPRTLGSDAHAACRDYLLKQLALFSDTAYLQSFTAHTYDGHNWQADNIIASFAPQNPERVVLAAHWDARPFADHDPNPANRDKAIDGANDGASGVGVLLEVARQLQKNRPDIGVDIVLFDAEDYGPKEGVEAPPGEWWGLGSQYWAKNPHQPGYRARYGILLDMVGAPNACFYQEQFSMRDAQPVVANVWATAYEIGYGAYFINKPGGVITDDHYYVNKFSSVRMIDIIHYDAISGTGFSPVWHTLDDNIQHIDKNTLGVVGKTLLQVIKKEK